MTGLAQYSTPEYNKYHQKKQDTPHPRIKAIPHNSKCRYKEGKNWKMLADQSSNSIAATPEGVPFKFNPQTVRYVKITFLGNSAGNEYKKKTEKDDERFIYFGMLFHRKYKM